MGISQQLSEYPSVCATFSHPVMKMTDGMRRKSRRRSRPEGGETGPSEAGLEGEQEWSRGTN